MSVLSGKPKALAFDKAEEHKRLDGVHGRIFVWRLSSRIYASQVEGYLDRNMAQLIIDIGEPLYGKGVVSGFHTWFGMTGYATASRLDLTGWVKRHRSESRLFIGLQSRLVAMGVSVANLALGSMIQTFSSAASLEAALAEEMGKTG
jgi:hypothetical protein